jgi:serine/threonine-protein kinase
LERLSSTVTKAQAPPSGRGGASQARFSAGDILAGRYRIVDRLGKGGMGEVYRADDLKLEQSVALKFLPEEVERDEARLAHFRSEVRLARHVSHQNVCRVHDIGEVDGKHFLSMEYIDGEDLGSLLRRIGRLPGDKATEIARELCAGLAAAHEKGVLHRDLKPANIMIDGRGQVRITDFGLAGVAGTIEGAEVRYGTPAFMAPEQWAGTEVSIRSDVYSLGLILYELFTGKRAFEANTAQDLMHRQRDTTPRNPSSLVEDLDPAAERVILRCLEKDPGKRPPSAIAIAAALPGGDPLAAAIAAGETPSPELVAQAGVVGFRPAVAWACLVGVVLEVLLLVGISDRVKLTQLVSLSKSPEILAEKAREVIQRLGYTDPPRDSTYGFSYSADYLDHIAETDDSAQRWDRLAADQPAAVTFWYRQSPRYLVPHRITSIFAWDYDPPPEHAGMVGVELDLQGRLRAFSEVTPEFDDTEGQGPEPDWSALFAEAGLDLGEFEPVEPVWHPASYAEHLAAWKGVYPDAPDTPIRVEAAAYRGRPVAFRIIDPWTRPSRMDVPESGSLATPAGNVFSPLAAVVHIAANVLAIIGAALLARRNLRLGRGDRRGAFRLALYMFALVMLHWLFGAHHVPDSFEVDIFFGGLYRGFFIFALAWLFYMALEPYVRRLWPEMMVSWMRLLDGRFRDPLVGRDMLMGCLLGGLLVLVQRLYQWVPTELGYFAPRPDRLGNTGAELITLRGVGHFVSQAFLIHSNTLITCLYFIVALFLLRLLLRKTWLSVGVWLALFALIYNVRAGHPQLDWMVFAIWGAVWLFFLFRFGWVSVIVGTFVMDLLATPLSLDPTAWYAGTSIVAIAVVIGLAVYGFKLSLAGQPVFKDVVVET